MDRQRLTITLRKDLLKDVDDTIDGAKVRNRSHAIEYLLGQALRPRVERAVVLAGGKGVNMRPFTYEMPKTMLPVGGRPILEYTVERLQKAGVRRITIVIGHLGDKIRDHFGDGSAFGVRIDYYEQPKDQIGTAYALTQIKGLGTGNPFYVVYGDTLVDIDLEDLFETHDSTDAMLTAALTSVGQPGTFGVATLRGYKIVDFDEKPGKGKGRTHLVSAGVFVCAPEVVGMIPKKATASIEQDVLPQLVREQGAVGYPFEGAWYDVSTPDIYEQVIQEWPTD